MGAEVTDKEALLVGLFMSLFADQNISKERMLYLCQSKKLASAYDLIKPKSTGGSSNE